MPSPQDVAPNPIPFPQHFRQAVGGLRGALTELLATVPNLPERPLPMARHLGLNKNLIWKVVRIVKADDAVEAVQHIPGEGGMRRVLEACSDHGAGEPQVEAVRRALAEFERMVAVHTGDRASLELMLGSLAPERPDRARVEAARKLAFQGNSATLGVQARARIGFQAVAPSPTESDRVDILAVGGLVGFRRLRANAVWSLLRTQGYTDADGPDNMDREPLSGEEHNPLVEEFCSKPLGKIRALPLGSGMNYELCEGPVGHTAESTFVFGWITRGLGSVHGNAEGDVAEFMVSLQTPAEALVFDLLVHRDLPFHGLPSLAVYSAMQGQAPFPLSEHGRYQVVIEREVQELGRGLTGVPTPHYSRQRELMEHALGRAGWDPEEFRVLRLELAYPPIPATGVLSYPLLAPRR